MGWYIFWCGCGKCHYGQGSASCTCNANIRKVLQTEGSFKTNRLIVHFYIIFFVHWVLTFYSRCFHWKTWTCYRGQLYEENNKETFQSSLSSELKPLLDDDIIDVTIEKTEDEDYEKYANNEEYDTNNSEYIEFSIRGDKYSE